MGARGYVSKSASAEELVVAVRNVLAERRHVEADIAAQLAVDPPKDGDPLRLLTNREVDIMRLLGEGDLAASVEGEELLTIPAANVWLVDDMTWWELPSRAVRHAAG